MVKESPKIKRQIKNHKKFFETYELYTYSYRQEGKEYCFVQYFLFGKPTEFLILTIDGDLPSRQVAEEVSTNVIYYNSVTRNAGVMADFKDKEIWMFKEVSNGLNALYDHLKDDFHLIERDYQKYLDLTEVVHRSKSKLDSYWDKMRDLDVDVQSRRQFLTAEDAEKMLDLSCSFDEALYERGLWILESLPSIKNIIGFLEEHKNKIPDYMDETYDKTLSLLKDNSHPAVIDNLKQSQASFETDIHNNPVTFPNNEIGLQEMRKNILAHMHHDTQNSIHNSLRGAWT